MDQLFEITYSNKDFPPGTSISGVRVTATATDGTVAFTQTVPPATPEVNVTNLPVGVIAITVDNLDASGNVLLSCGTTFTVPEPNVTLSVATAIAPMITVSVATDVAPA